MVKRSSRASKASTPCKASKASALSTPSKAVNDVKPSARSTQEESGLSTPSKAVKDLKEHITPRRVPKTSLKQDSKTDDKHDVLLKPSDHEEDAAKSKLDSKALQSATEALVPLISAASSLDAVLEKHTDQAEVSEDEDWTLQIKKPERSVSTTSTREPRSENFFIEFKNID